MRTVNIVDTTPPTIAILGENPTTIALGGVYTDAGATATDVVDGDLTASIVVDDQVDSNTIGTYFVGFTVINAAGESASAERVVNVIEPPQQLLFVDLNAPADGDGRSKSPFNTIGQALSLSTTVTDAIIVVRRGLYPETLFVGEGVTIRSEEGAFHTIIDGGGTPGDIVTLSDGAKLVGFTVGKGQGAAVRVLELAEATVSNNALHTVSTGLAAEPNSVTRFTNNTVYSTGVGVFGEPSAVFARLKNSIFKGNDTAISMDAGAILGGDEPGHKLATRAGSTRGARTELHGSFNPQPSQIPIRKQASQSQAYRVHRTLMFNLFFENGTDFVGSAPATTDLFADPQFVNPSELNFHLQSASPARDGGDPSAAFNDVDGSVNDLGADGGPLGVRDFEVPFAILTVVGETTVDAPALVEFDAFASFDEYGIDEIVWDFDRLDGLGVDATGEAVSRTFDTAGQFIVTLLVTDHSGLEGRARVEIAVSEDRNMPPTGGASVTPNAGAAPLTVTFSGHGTDPDGGNVTFSWELDDGNHAFSTNQNPVLTFPEGTPPGSKRVIMTLTDDEGTQTQRMTFVTITEGQEDISGVVDPDAEITVMINDASSALDETEVTIPTGATDEPIVITISPVDEILPQFNENFGNLTQLGPAGHVFSRPVTVAIPHPAELLHNDVIEVFWYDEENESWRNDGIFNVTHIDGFQRHFVRFETSHFTIFNTSSIIPRTIQGIVVSEVDETAIEGASIKLASESLEAFSDGDGLYTFVRDFEPGTYDVSVTADGFQDETKSYELSSSAVSKLNFQMKNTITEFPRISLSQSSFTNIPNEGDTLTVDVSNSGEGTLDWSVAVSDGSEWLSVAASETSITITVAENTGSEPRDGVVRVTDPTATNSPVDIAVWQAGQAKGCSGAGGFVSFTVAWGDVLVFLLMTVGLWAHGRWRREPTVAGGE